MSKLLFPLSAPALLPVVGSEAMFPVNRIFCVGRNYAEHAKEMGGEVDREAPFYFTKSPAHLARSGATIPYPPGTADYHHEMEFVVALGAPAFEVSAGRAMEAVFGYACGLDMTRRDLQAASKEKRRSWDTGKDFENAAVIGAITPKAAFGIPGPQAIALKVGSRVAQSSHLSDMVWTVADIVAHLSALYHLAPGDLIMTGTPAGVGPVGPGDVLHGTIDGLEPVELAIDPAE